MKIQKLLPLCLLLLYATVALAQVPYFAQPGENLLRLQLINQSGDNLSKLTVRLHPSHPQWLVPKGEATIDLAAYRAGSEASNNVELFDLPFEVAGSNIFDSEIQFQLVCSGQILGAFKVLLTFSHGDGNTPVSLSKGETTEKQSEPFIDETASFSTPTSYALSQNYPNPFNPATNIEVQLPENGWTVLKVYDVLGRGVKTLVNRELAAGTHILTWDGTDDEAKIVPSGVYIYRLTTSKFISVKKMVVLR
jgi:hypothetical protein